MVPGLGNCLPRSYKYLDESSEGRCWGQRCTMISYHSADSPSRLKQATVVVLAWALALAPTPAHAQELTGWRTIHSSARYDYLISDSSAATGAPPAPAGDTATVLLSRMLVRDIEAGRAAVLAWRTEAASDTTGYDRYASTTERYAVRCSTRRLTLQESTDFDADGVRLEQRFLADAWRTPERFPEPEVMEALLRWKCFAWWKGVSPSSRRFISS
jgi:hypothetical protein